MITDFGYNREGIKETTPDTVGSISASQGIGVADVNVANNPGNPQEIRDGQFNGDMQIVNGHLQSSNFISGQIGWIINYDGTAEFQNVNIGNKILTINSTQSISAAISILTTAGGGVLNLKPGTYTVSTPIVGISNIQIIGESAGTTLIDFNSTSANLSFTGTNVYSTGTITVASGVNITGSGTSWLANVTAGQFLFLGTRWYLIAAVTGDTTLILAEAYGDNVTLPSAYRIATIQRNIVIKQLTMKNSTGTALAMTDCREIVLSDIVFLDNNIGYSLTNVSLASQTRLFPVSNTSHGYQLTNVGLCSLFNVNSVGNGGNGVTVSNVKTATWRDSTASSNTLDGINLTTTVNCAFFGEFSANGGQGMEFVLGCNTNDIYNSIIQNNTSDGIKLTATDDNNKIYGSNISGNGGYGINIAASTDDNNIITTNNFSTNTSGPINDSGTGTIIRGNSGVTDNSASQQSTSGYVFTGYYTDGFTTSGTGTVTRELVTTYLATGGTSGNSMALRSSTIGRNTGNTVFDWNDYDMTFGIVQSMGATTSQDAFWGLFRDGSGPADDATSVIRHIGFYLADGTLYASNANGTTQTKTDISSFVTLTNNIYYQFVYDLGVNIKFYINNSLVATHTTNLPTGTAGEEPNILMYAKTQENAAKTMIFSNNYSLVLTI